MKATSVTVSWIFVLAAAVACAQGARGPRFAVEHEWSGKGQWLRGDTHLHTRASDGGHEIEPLVAKAKAHGCDVIAITDHADRQLRAATPEYILGIGAATKANPDMVVIPGLEWNVPPSGGNEHATLLVPDDRAAGPMLAEFKRRFDDYDRDDGAKPSAEEALRWLVETARGQPVKPVVIYNHPSRKDESSQLNVDDMIRWRGVNDLVIGFEGGPGHQGKPPIGSYSGKETPIDRWDPVVAKTGGAWDQLLQQGYDVHGAVASSDFHSERPDDLGDYWPCQFAETRYYVPEKTVSGVLRAMRAGSFFGSHGRIVTGLDLTVLVDGLPRPVMAGEAVQVPTGSEVAVALSVEIPERDWQGQPNRVDSAEIFLITPTKVETRLRPITGTGTQVVGDRITVGKEGLVVRARVRRDVPDGPDLMAYTNAIRIRVF